MEDSPIPCFVVSLTSARSRRAAIGDRLKQLSIPFEFIDAVDASEGLDSRYDDLIDRSPELCISPGEYGCALSHASIYERMVRDNIAYALVLEDDAIVYRSLAEFIRNRSYELAPMFQLYHSRAYVRAGYETPLFDNVFQRPLSLSCNHTVAYTLNLNIAKQLLQACRPVRTVADWPLDMARLGACITQPVLVQHPIDSRKSSIAAQHKPKRFSRYWSAQYYRRRWLKMISERLESPIVT